MIEIYGEKRGTRIRLYLTGHAGEGEEAMRVCAGVSALCGALADYARGCGNCRHLRVEAEKGRLFLSCHGGLGAAYDMVWQGLVQLSAAYPDCLSVRAHFEEDGLTTGAVLCDRMGMGGERAGSLAV